MRDTSHKAIFFAMCLRLLNICSINAMDNTEPDEIMQGEYGENYTLREMEWSNQTVNKIEMNDGVAIASFICVLPLIAGLKPIIGYISCTCSNTAGHSKNKRHRTIMIDGFKSMLTYLASKGYKEVVFPDALHVSPPCLARYIRNSDNVPIIAINDHEYTTTTTHA